jgi:hypothetical protein
LELFAYLKVLSTHSLVQAEDTYQNNPADIETGCLSNTSPSSTVTPISILTKTKLKNNYIYLIKDDNVGEACSTQAQICMNWVRKSGGRKPLRKYLSTVGYH